MSQAMVAAIFQANHIGTTNSEPGIRVQADVDNAAAFSPRIRMLQYTCFGVAVRLGGYRQV